MVFHRVQFLTPLQNYHILQPLMVIVTIPMTKTMLPQIIVMMISNIITLYLPQLIVPGRIFVIIPEFYLRLGQPTTEVQLIGHPFMRCWLGGVFES